MKGTILVILIAAIAIVLFVQNHKRTEPTPSGGTAEHSEVNAPQPSADVSAIPAQDQSPEPSTNQANNEETSKKEPLAPVYEAPLNSTILVQ